MEKKNLKKWRLITHNATLIQHLFPHFTPDLIKSTKITPKMSRLIIRYFSFLVHFGGKSAPGRTISCLSVSWVSWFMFFFRLSNTSGRFFGILWNEKHTKKVDSMRGRWIKKKKPVKIYKNTWKVILNVKIFYFYSLNNDVKHK